MCSPPSPTRSRTRGHRTATAPMPVTISRSGRCPWRTSRRRPSSVNLSVWVLSQAATSASTACPNSVLAPLRKTSVSGSENVPGWVSSKTLVSVTAYHSFGGEVEALNTPTIRRLTPSCRHQLSALAQAQGAGSQGCAGRPDPDRGASHCLGESQDRKGGARRVRERMPGLLRRPGHVLCRQHEGRRPHLPTDLRRHLFEARIRKAL